MILGLPSWPATLQPFALVTSPRLGLRYEGCEALVKDLFILMEVRGSNFHIRTLWVNLGQTKYVLSNEVRLYMLY